MTKKFRCLVCGYIHEGETAPQECPLCHVGPEDFEQLEETEGELTWADEQILDWRYTEAGIVNHTFCANGVDITKHFYAKDRKRYTLSVGSWDKKRIHITIDTYQYSSLAKKGKKKFVCSICGEEHLVEEGAFLPHPVRPNKDSNGQYNYCCATCYEKYVGPMQACRWEIGTLWTKIKELEFWGHTWSKEDMFYEMTIAVMDSIIKQGNVTRYADYDMLVDALKDYYWQDMPLTDKKRSGGIK